MTSGDSAMISASKQLFSFRPQSFVLCTSNPALKKKKNNNNNPREYSHASVATFCVPPYSLVTCSTNFNYFSRS